MPAITKADIHLLILASDIRAPIGLEWHLARRTHHPAGSIFEAEYGSYNSSSGFHTFH